LALSPVFCDVPQAKHSLPREMTLSERERIKLASRRGRCKQDVVEFFIAGGIRLGRMKLVGEG